MTRPPEEFDLVLELHRQGLGYRRIARATGIPRKTIIDWIKGRRKYRTRRRECPKADGVFTCAREVKPDMYAYMLGAYLGDGYIVKMGRSFSMQLFCDARYPGIIESWRIGLASLRPNLVRVVEVRENCTRIAAYSIHWPHLFPQHGPGRKHTRPIVLEAWQEAIIDEHPRPFVRGLIESDGCRVINRVMNRRYAYVRYMFSNRSKDILCLFGDACDRIGVEWRFNNWYSISVARRESVEILDGFIGPKR